MKIKNVKLNLSNFTNGGPAVLTEVKPAFNYRDGQRVDTEIVGRKVTVVFPANSYDTLTVTVADPVDALSPLLDKATTEKPVYVTFDGFKAKIYTMQGNTDISAKASAVRVVTAPGGVEDDLLDLD